jgi:hypothetical protein
MGFIRIETSVPATLKKLKRLRKALTPEAQNMILRKSAEIWHARMVMATPKRWTGQTRKMWRVVPMPSSRGSGWTVVNTSKVMVFLEQGTRAHGPKKAKRLFVPLTRRAAMAGPQVVVAELIAAREAKRRPKYRVGKDFVFAKRVRGIRGIWIVRHARRFMRSTTQMAMRQFIQAVLDAP